MPLSVVVQTMRDKGLCDDDITVHSCTFYRHGQRFESYWYDDTFQLKQQCQLVNEKFIRKTPIESTWQCK